MFPSWAFTPIGWFQALTLAFVLVRPGSTMGFAAFVLASSLRGLEKMPFMANHIFFELVLSLTMLAAFVTLALRKRSLRVDGAEWFALFAPVVRFQIAILYFFAVLHKLNTDYFDPEVSCGSRLLTLLMDRFGLDAQTFDVRQLSIVGTLLVETAIPLGLLLTRTRMAALALAVGFHYMLGFLPHEGLPSFSGMLFGLFVLFFPDSFLPTLTGWLDERRRQFAFVWQGPDGKPSRQRISLAVAVAAFVIGGLGLALLLIDTEFDQRRQRTLLGFDLNQAQAYLDRVSLVAFVLCGTAYIVMLTRCYRSVRGFRYGEIAGFWGRPSWIWALCLVTLLAGFGPYLGLRTQISFSMFSNLRTEDRHNHLFIPGNWHLFGQQRDMLQVLSGLPPRVLANGPTFQVNAIEFRRVFAEAKPGTTVTYLRNGEVRTIVKGEPHPRDRDLAKPLGFWERKYWLFRFIETAGPRQCRH